jgi:LPXTG-motif cell wall-anchored protein
MPGNPLTDPQWAPNLADTIERVVGNIRDKTTKPLLVAYRAVVFGLIAAFGGVVALVLLLIALSRALQALIGLGVDHHNAVWISYLGLGALFSLGGLFAMKRRFPAEGEPA